MIYRQFTVSDRNGCVADLVPETTTRMPEWADGVEQSVKTDWTPPKEAFFAPPVPYVMPPAAGAGEPFFPHNHCPALTGCPNGDLLAAWFSTHREKGTEMTILASRLRAGSRAWEPSSEFFKAADRNMTGTALFHDGNGTLYHFNGMGPEGVEGLANLVALLRVSRDNGVNWTPPQVISPEPRYRLRCQIIAGTNMTPDGDWLQPCDATPGCEGPTALYVSRDRGRTWSDPGGDIRGIHAGVAGLRDGRWLAFGRGQDMDGLMPMSISTDKGKSWQSRPSPFPPIRNAQRLVLLRLDEGPLLLVSFTDAVHRQPREARQGMRFQGLDSRVFTGYGLFAALSRDEGETWPVRRLLTPGEGEYDGAGHTGRFTASPTEAEPKGYLAATQTPDGVIHLISSGLYYHFNLAWLEAVDGFSTGDRI